MCRVVYAYGFDVTNQYNTKDMVEEYVSENFKPPKYGCGGVCYIYKSSEQLLHKINMQKNLKSELGRKDVFKVHSYIYLCCRTLSLSSLIRAKAFW